MINKKILFVGAGNMGEGILKGVITKKIAKVDTITAFDVNEKRTTYIRETYEVNISKDLASGVSKAEIVIIAVKPQDIVHVLEVINENNKECLVVSIAAGIKIDFIENIIGQDRRVVRVMPNPMCESGYGVTAICWNDKVEEDENKQVQDIFSSIGKVALLKERLFNAFTGFSGSGSAYVLEFIEAMTEAGVLVGLTAEDSCEFAVQNIMAASKTVMDSKKHPALLKQKVSSPAGTTIAGLRVLYKNGFKGIVMDCVKSAVDRSEELGK